MNQASYFFKYALKSWRQSAVFLIGIIGASTVLYNCNPPAENDFSQRSSALIKNEKAIQCQLSFLKKTIQTEWDQIAQLLDENLPEEMPADEKANMIAVRNANLIRMFQSYDNLDEGIKKAISKADSLDKVILQKVTAAKKELETIEGEKIEFLESLNSTEQSKFLQHREQEKAKPCP